jgi:hypothetical protein
MPHPAMQAVVPQAVVRPATSAGDDEAHQADELQGQQRDVPPTEPLGDGHR